MGEPSRWRKVRNGMIGGLLAAMEAARSKYISDCDRKKTFESANFERGTYRAESTARTVLLLFSPPAQLVT